MPDPITAPYGSWRSPITSDLIVAESISLHDVLLDGKDIYWLEGRPREGGRYVLVRRKADGSTSDVNPPPFNARTRVHEYGGGSVCLFGGNAFFSNYADQRLYEQFPRKRPAPLTPEPDEPERHLRYADGEMDVSRKRWIGVREDHLSSSREAVNTIVAVNVIAGGPGEVLVQGHDFYACPRLSPDGKKLAWMAWNHPNMPWDDSELWLGNVTPTGKVTRAARVAGGPGESVFQPSWSPDGVLHFISDRTNWWNLYRLDGKKAVPLCPLEGEFGVAQWTFGLSTYAFTSKGRIACAYSHQGLGRLGIFDPESGSLTPLDLPFTDFAFVRARGKEVVCRAGSPSHPHAVVRIDIDTGKYDVLRTASAVAEKPEIKRYFTTPRPIEFPTEGGKTAFALYYPPANPDYRVPAGDRPPLVVKCHGGPTSMAGSTLSLGIQFWTSRGIGVVDVNYGGSTGFGRAYRERLKPNWGIVDVDDCVNAARYLAQEGLVDAARTVITGGSAGGYTTLAALAFRDYFKGGGSHYGVSDLGALARDTHKFESRYLDMLIGPYPAAEAIYRERSPVFFAERVKAPVIFFQGDEDRIVPVSQTEDMVEALRRAGLPVGYLLFAGEQHGFRKSENIKRALDAELYFYAALVFRVGLGF